MPEMERFIQSQVESGKYGSAADVIQAGIRRLEESNSLYEGRFEQLRQEVSIEIEQIDRGEVVDGAVIFQQLREKLQQRRSQANQ